MSVFILAAIIPTEIGRLRQLVAIGLEDNVSPFPCLIPHELFNISTLRKVQFSSSSLSGTLPSNLCYRSPALEEVNLGGNNLSGIIPESISNCSNLRMLDLTASGFTGFLPLSLGNLRFLERLLLSGNNLKSDTSSLELSFITSLTNSRRLVYLELSHNPLEGIIPASVGNFSSSLQIFSAKNCKIKGSIPPSFGNLSSNLGRLYISNNELFGSIPPTLGRLSGLQGLALGNNMLEGPIPEGLCDLHCVVILSVGSNKLSGPVLECLGNMSSLQHIFLQSNMLNSSIPSTLWHLKDLLQLDLSSNHLSGLLSPDIGNLLSAIYINISSNQLSESIPSTIGNLQNLAELSLARNRFEGDIPVSMGKLINLKYVDLSYNNLSGSIPKSLETLQYLHYFNVSFNALSGEIPAGGSFVTFTADSFKGNEALCGSPRFGVPLCPATSNRNLKRKKVVRALFILAGIVAFIMLSSLAFIFIRYRRNRKAAAARTVELISTVPERISYSEILLATEQFNESNLLGSGSFGHVYRGILRDGRVIAVKVFNLELDLSFKSFGVECEVLRNLRHRNLTKVISSCSNEDFKALVLEYMPNGNLDKWLYCHNYFLDVMQRLNIMIDVASALEYLHHGYSTPVVHCDLKPSNVLLDEEMTAHVSDFGLSKMLGDGESTVLTNTLATPGYIAPGKILSYIHLFTQILACLRYIPDAYWILFF